MPVPRSFVNYPYNVDHHVKLSQSRQAYYENVARHAPHGASQTNCVSQVSTTRTICDNYGCCG